MQHPHIAQINARAQNPILPWVIGGIAAAGAAAYGAWRCAPGTRMQTKKTVSIGGEEVTGDFILEFSGCFKGDPKPWKVHANFHAPSIPAGEGKAELEFATKEEAVVAIDNCMPKMTDGEVTLKNGDTFTSAIAYSGCMVLPGVTFDPLKPWAAFYSVEKKDFKTGASGMEAFATEEKAITWLDNERRQLDGATGSSFKLGNPLSRRRRRVQTPRAICFDTKNGGKCCVATGPTGPGQVPPGTLQCRGPSSIQSNPRRRNCSKSKTRGPTGCEWVRQPDGTYKDTCNKAYSREKNPLLAWVVGGLVVAGVTAYGAFRCKSGQKFQRKEQFTVEDETLDIDAVLTYGGCFSGDDKPWKTTITFVLDGGTPNSLDADFSTKDAALSHIENCIPKITLDDELGIVAYRGCVPGAWENLRWRAIHKVFGKVKDFATEDEAMFWLNSFGADSLQGNPACPGGCGKTMICCLADGKCVNRSAECGIISAGASATARAVMRQRGYNPGPPPYEGTCMQECVSKGYSDEACREHCSAKKFRSIGQQPRIGQCATTKHERCCWTAKGWSCTPRSSIRFRSVNPKRLSYRIGQWFGGTHPKKVSRRSRAEVTTLPPRLGDAGLIPRFV